MTSYMALHDCEYHVIVSIHYVSFIPTFWFECIWSDAKEHLMEEYGFPASPFLYHLKDAKHWHEEVEGIDSKMLVSIFI